MSSTGFRKVESRRLPTIRPARTSIGQVRKGVIVLASASVVLVIVGMITGWIDTTALSECSSRVAGRIREASDGDWWVAPLMVFALMALVEIVISLFLRFVPVRSGHEWEVPDSELTPDELAERREYEAEVDARDPHRESRGFILKRSTWFSVGAFALALGATLAVDLAGSWLVANRKGVDTVEEMSAIARRCPPLREDVQASLSRGGVTADQLESMRVRAEVISAHLVRGQECSA